MSTPAAASFPNASVARRGDGRFYVGMALVAAATALMGFVPALVAPASRRGPLSWEVGVHGLIFSAWLLLFLTQALLAQKGRIATHRRLGMAGAGLALLMLFSGYFTTIAMARRGYDLSGELIGDSGSMPMLMVFQLGDLLCFGVLVALGVWFRRRSGVHKRLMLLATVGGLMPAALSHIIGHSHFLRGLHPAIILVPYTAMLFAGAVHDRLTMGKIHPVSLWVALAIFAFSNLRAAVIGPSDAWQEFAAWLVR